MSGKFILQIFLATLAIVSLGTALWLAANGKEGAWIAVTLVVISLIFMHLAHFKKFRGFGVEAETWEQEMEEAKQLTSTLRALILAVAEPLISITARAGRMGSHFSHAETFRVMQSIEKILKDQKFTSEEIEAVKKDWKCYTIFDIGMIMREKISESLKNVEKTFVSEVEKFGGHITAENRQPHSEAVERWRSFVAWKERLLDRFEFSNSESLPDGIINEITKSPYLTLQHANDLIRTIEPLIEDINHLKQLGLIRRPGVWFAEKVP